MLDALLDEMMGQGGSDLHIAAGQMAMMRVDGQIRPIRGSQQLSPDATERMLLGVLDAPRRKKLEEISSVEFMYEVELPSGPRRFRASLFRDRSGLNGAFRRIAETPPTLAELNLPQRLEELVSHKQGLVLVTGPTGCGKTSTLAALVAHLNDTRSGHVVTLEDPIEYVHKSDRCLVSQREIGRDTRSFATGLRAALREAPDVILVGELRDLESTSLAVTAAETGHLVLATTHTNSAPSTVERLIYAFPAEQQSQVRTMLAESVRGIVTQHLLPRADNRARVPAVEVMLGSPAISNLIREGRTFQIQGVIETSRFQGMQSLDQCLQDLLDAKLITKRTAWQHASERSQFE